MSKTTIIFLLFGLAIAQDYRDDLDAVLGRNPVVRIEQGRVRGIGQRTVLGRGIYSFKGIPYVEPAIGDLRFKPPVYPKPWTGIYDATKDKPACPQPLLESDEDCLHVYVHTPRLPSLHYRPRYPVILYVHPGSWTTLAGISSFVGPDYLLDENVVLVSFNYRLAGLGFLSTGDELAPGNNGLKDQVYAMRWVQRNVAAFGGDPGSVTLAGYSAGGLGVSLHIASPMAAGLFHKVMIMSGSAAGNLIPRTEQFDLAQKQATMVGCPNDTSVNIINCLRNVSAERLGNSLEEFRVFGNDPQFFWQVVFEPDFGQERYMIENPLVSIRCGRVADVPVYTGITRDELIALAYPVVRNDTWLEVFNGDSENIWPYSFYYEPGAPASANVTRELSRFYFGGRPVTRNSLVPLGEAYSDSLSGFAVNRGAQLLSDELKSKVYYYIFTYKGRFSNFNPPEGNDQYVVHFDDLLYVFWNSRFFPRFNATDPEYQVVRRMTRLYVNFARWGNPTPWRQSALGGVLWQDFNATNNMYLDIDENLSMKTNIYPDRYAEWRRLTPLPPANCGSS